MKNVNVLNGNGVYLATDKDFKGTENGEFRYIGDAEIVEIPHIIKGVEITSYQEMFSETNVEKVISTNSNVIDMSYMFYYSKATTLDLSNFDTSNVTNMKGMFWGSQATSLDLSSFDTSNVEDMSEMFNSYQATSLDLSSFDTSKVANMRGMFSCSQMESLDLSNFTFAISPRPFYDRVIIFNIFKNMNVTVYVKDKEDVEFIKKNQGIIRSKGRKIIKVKK